MSHDAMQAVPGGFAGTEQPIRREPAPGTPKHPLVYERGWTIIENGFQPDARALHHLETVFTLGNGYFCTRGTFEEGFPDAWTATFINGVYDHVQLAYTELANCPDWLSLFVSIEGEFISLARGELLSYHRSLDLRRGILRREIAWRSPRGRTVDLQFERFISLADRHVAALRLTVTPLDFDGRIEVLSGINGYPDNQGVKHWEWLDQGGLQCDGQGGASVDGVWLQARTNHSRIELGMACRLQARIDGEPLQTSSSAAPGYPTLHAMADVPAGQSLQLEKTVGLFTSRDHESPVQAACDKIAALPGYEAIQRAHRDAWDEVWQACDVVIDGDARAQIAIRYNIFQLMQAAPRHDDTVSIPAKTLSGFAYRGHVFWDTELFILPFFVFSFPDIARNLLMYRHQRLPGARRKAARSGYQGAMFPWESAASGDEVTPRWLPDIEGRELIRIWCGDLEQHISSDIAYAAWQYWQATGDDDWMRRHGAEILLDTAVFWSSRVEWIEERQRYEIRKVMGPDEYHEHVDNNAFTNGMVRWHLEKSAEVWQWLQAHDATAAERLAGQLGIDDSMREGWSRIGARIWVPMDEQRGLIEQSEGFFQLEDIDLAAYEPRHRSIQAILGIERTNQCQVIKQADALMLLYLLRNRYGYEALRTNWEYYSPRTDHTYGSSLSPAIHAVLACELGAPQEAYEHFMRAAMVDLEDVRDNAGEGIHGASAGAVWQAVVFGFGGVRVGDAGLSNTLHLPPGWTRLKFRMRWRGKTCSFDSAAQPIRPAAARTACWPGAPARIRGVIFDLDGVLTDTAEYHYLAWQRLADEEGIPFDRRANEPLRGISRRESLLLLLDGRVVSEQEMEQMMERKNRYYLEFIERMTPADLLPGSLELLDELRGKGIRVAIGSASKNARTVIDRLGIADRIDALADGNSVSRSKPAPDLFLHAARLLRLPAEECAVVEDADAGTQAALAGNMWSIGLGPRERFREAHLTLASLEGVHWDQVLAALSRIEQAPAAPGTI